MLFELYAGVWPNHFLLDKFKTISEAKAHGELINAGKVMFINYNNQTVSIYNPYFKTWGFVNHK